MLECDIQIQMKNDLQAILTKVTWHIIDGQTNHDSITEDGIRYAFSVITTDKFLKFSRKEEPK